MIYTLRWLCLLGSVLASLGHAQTVLQRGHGKDISTLDPQRAITNYEQAICYDLFSGLVQFDAEGKIVPGMAERWEIIAEGCVYRFFLRPSKWSDGSDVVADDFVYSFQRLANPAQGSSYQFLVSPIQNGQAIIDGKIKDLTKLGVQASDQFTLEIRLEKPILHFLSILAHVGAVPLKRSCLEKYGSQWVKPRNIISNGPYQLQEFRPKSRVRLKKNPYYWGANQVHLDQVDYYLGAEVDTEFAMFQRGRLDVTCQIPIDKVQEAKQKFQQELKFFPLPGVMVLIANQRSPLVDKMRCKALSLALDRERLASLNRLEEVPAYGLIPAEASSDVPASLEHAAESQAFRGEEAKKVWALPKDKRSGTKIRLLADTQRKRQAVAIARMWEEALQAKVALDIRDWQGYCQGLKNRDFDFVLVTFTYDYDDPLAFLDFFAYPSSGVNFGGYDNTAYRQLIQQATYSVDPSERLEYITKAVQILLDDYAVIPVYFPVVARLVKSELAGYQANFLDIHPSQYLSFSKAQENAE